jgi:hypothetical protein
MLQSSVISLFLVLLLSGCAAPDTQPPPAGVGSPNTAYSSTPATAQQGEVSTAERERWLADTDPQAMTVLKFWFEEWDEERIHGGKGNYNDKWFPHGPLGAEGSKEIDREITEHFADLFEEAVNGRLD